MKYVIQSYARFDFHYDLSVSREIREEIMLK